LHVSVGSHRCGERERCECSQAKTLIHWKVLLAELNPQVVYGD